MTPPSESETDTIRSETDARRSLLAVRANPAQRLDYRVTLTGGVSSGTHGTLALTLAYVPDRVVLDPCGFARYATALGEETWPELEALGVLILDDVNNEVVPRWLHLTVQAGAHMVTLTDSQPGWTDRLALTLAPSTRPGFQAGG